MTATAGRYPRFGVEEEFFLLDAADGRSIPVASSVIAELPPRARERSKTEFLASQLEHATGICTSAEDARDQLREFRSGLAAASASVGSVAAGMGTPFRAEEHPTLSPGARYQELAHRHASLIDEHQVAALHIHVEVLDPDAAIRSLRILAAWLPFLKAITGNSPWWNGSDTGFDSWRAILLRRWTTNGCPPAVSTPAEYAARASALVGVGGTRDVATVAWDVRLSPRYPTVELRVVDSQLTTDDALLVALIARGLVSSAIQRREATDFTPELVDAALWHAARFGCSEGISLPGEGDLVSADAAMVHLANSLDASDGDTELIQRGLHRLNTEGTGADRQRAAAGVDGWPSLRTYLAEALVAS